MKTKFLSLILLVLMVTGIAGCSKNEYDPEDFVTSVLSGEYGKDMLWKLSVTVNGNATESGGYIRFESKDLKEADFRFVDVIQGVPLKEFRNVPLSATSTGYGFSMEYQSADQKVIITGTVSLGEMTVDINM